MKINDFQARRLQILPRTRPLAPASRAPARPLGAGPYGDSSFSPAPAFSDGNAARLLGLKRGSVGTDGRIQQLQDDLMKRGFLQNIRANPGYGNTFGPLTEAALKKLQASQGLPQTGQVDAATVAALVGAPASTPSPITTPPPPPLTGTAYPGAPGGDPNAADMVGLQRGIGTPAQVKQLQDDLIGMGCLDPAMKQNSGYGHLFGPLTEAGVKAFQQDNGLPQTGVVDAATASALAGPRPKAAPIAAGPALALRAQLGLPVSAAVTLADGSVQQRFDHGSVLASATGTLYVRDAQGQDLVPPQKLGAATSVDQANQSFLSQWGPTPFNSAQGAPYGYEDCGPTSVAMVLSSLGLLAHPSPADAEKTIDHLRDQALGFDSTKSQGTYDSQLEKALTANGADAAVLKPISLDAINTAIGAGHPLIIGTGATWEAWGKARCTTGDYLNHQNPGGHYITVLGRATDGNYLVGDPLSKVGAIEVTSAQLQVALNGAWDGLEVSRH